MSYDDMLYIILLILIFILIERVFFDTNDIKSFNITKIIKDFKKIFSNTIFEGFDHQGESVIASNKNKSMSENASEYKLSEDERRVVESVKTSYTIAEQVAIIIIKMPYKFINLFLRGVFDMMVNIKNIFNPIIKLVKSLGDIYVNIIKKMYNTWLKYVKKFFNTMRNLPEFIQKMSMKFIDFITNSILRIIDLFSAFFGIFDKIFKLFMKIPTMLFSFMKSMSTMIINMIEIMFNLPTFFLNLNIKIQEKMMSMM